MCLYTKHLFPKIAWKNITCYKVLRPSIEGGYYTPYMQQHISVSEITNQHYLIADEPLFSILSSIARFRKVGKGYIHSYRSKPYFELDTVVECIIPRFTLYFEGRSNDFASRKIKFVKIIWDGV